MSTENGTLKVVTFRFCRLTVGSLFKIGFICNLFVWMPIGIGTGIQAFFGDGSVTVNEQTVTGFWALIAPVGFTFMFALVAAIILMLGGLLARFVNRWVSFGGIQYFES